MTGKKADLYNLIVLYSLKVREKSFSMYLPRIYLLFSQVYCTSLELGVKMLHLCANVDRDVTLYQFQLHREQSKYRCEMQIQTTTNADNHGGSPASKNSHHLHYLSLPAERLQKRAGKRGELKSRQLYQQ